jgi:pimeloyl-ACP methyl ester carboxylesterase
MIEAVEIVLPSGVVLRGELRRGGPDWVILVHDLNEDIDDWQTLPALLSASGSSVLAYDLRGHGGSDGDPGVDSTAIDLVAAIAWARSLGATAIHIGVSGRSTRAALKAAAVSGCGSLFALAPLGVDRDQTPVAKLAIVGSRDPDQDAAGTALSRSSGWWIVVRLPVAERGCSLLRSDWALNVQDTILTFLTHQRFAPHRSTRLIFPG